jgi:hypothetical protein
MSDEELEVGPKVKPEEAGSDASRRLNLKGSIGRSSEGSWKLAAGTAEGSIADASRQEIAGTAGGRDNRWKPGLVEGEGGRLISGASWKTIGRWS